MDLPLDFKDLLVEFARAKAETVLVGGYAVAFHGKPRSTKDIDLVLEGSPENLQRAAKALAIFGAPANVVSAVATMSPSDVVFMGQAPLRVDFLLQIDGVPAERVFSNAVLAELDDIRVKIISLDDLIDNKRAAGRPQDLIDVALLEKVRARRM